MSTEHVELTGSRLHINQWRHLLGVRLSDILNGKVMLVFEGLKSSNISLLELNARQGLKLAEALARVCEKAIYEASKQV